MHSPESPRPAAMAGRLGAHLVLSLSIAAAIAGAVSLPRILGPGSTPPAIVRLEPLAFTEEGKFADHLDPGLGEAQDPFRFTPATMAMPMSLFWNEPEAAAPVLPAVGVAPALARFRSAPIARAPLPPRRDPALAVGAPLPAAAATSAPVAGGNSAAGDRGWVRLVTAPAEKVAAVVSGAAERAEAVGSWTVSQASGLLPRW